jgi:hypothetical protein
MEPLDVRGFAARLGVSAGRISQLLRTEWFVELTHAYRLDPRGRWRFPPDRVATAIEELHTRSLAELRAEDSP